MNKVELTKIFKSKGFKNVIILQNNTMELGKVYNLDGMQYVVTKLNGKTLGE